MTVPLQVSDIAKAYRGRPVLRDLSFEVAPGEAFAIIGRNGSGKSTLLGCITAGRVPDRGEVRVCGADPFSDPRLAARCMGMVPEYPTLYDELAAREVVDFVIEVREMGEEGRREALRLTELLGISESMDQLVRELSQGTARKLSLVLALLHRPRLLVLDEAFNGLDAPSTEALTAELDRRREEGAGVLVSSHDLPFLARWCNRGLLLRPNAEAYLLEEDGWRRWCAEPDLEGRAFAQDNNEVTTSDRDNP